MKKLEVPENFDFPFPPYKIQHDFMSELFKVLENGNYGIFESPTGTGKSLSIICGALRWLKDHNQHDRNNLEVKIHELTKNKNKLDADEIDWLNSQAKGIEIGLELSKLKLQSKKIEEYDKKIENLKARKKKIVDRSKFIKNKLKNEEVHEEVADNEENDEDMLLEFDAITSEKENDEEDLEDKFEPIQIYICSRTHSQLSQFVGELRKSPFDIRVVSLASRQNYCINPDVLRLKNSTLINERCLDMQKSGSKTTKKDEDGKSTKRKKGETTCKCPYYKQEAIDELRDSALLDIQDVEDLVATGKVLKACPYYASRKAVEDAEVILVPYNTILHKATREANGIKLKNNVVIIDEAHNLLEALAQMYGSEVSYDQLDQALEQLKNYKAKYHTLFSALNLLRINQLIFVIKKLKIELEKKVELKNDGNVEIFSIPTFMLRAEIDNYNMFHLVKFIKDSRISQKLHGFVIKNPEGFQVKPEVKKGVKNFLRSIENKVKNLPPEVSEEPVKAKIRPGNPLLNFSAFLDSLTYSEEDGRILVHRGENKKLQFLLLNPSVPFIDIVKEARSIIVAGGTMKPISEFKERLFMNAGVNANKIIEFSCDHIVPPDNILPIIMKTGVYNEKLIFNYESRFKMGSNLKSLLLEVSKTVKGGIVVFFPSYKYEEWIWQQVQNVNFGKPVYREPQHSGSVDSVLDKYQKEIMRSNSKGALLFSVVGGKLSEGLNFSDDLGRCVVVIGLPYANINSPELKEKMTFLDKKGGSGSGNTFYENMCMKAVNQCIGRAVRHKNDYASVLLVDERYDRVRTKSALPDWIKRSLKACNYEETFNEMKKFFILRNK